MQYVHCTHIEYIIRLNILRSVKYRATASSANIKSESVSSLLLIFRLMLTALRLLNLERTILFFSSFISPFHLILSCSIILFHFDGFFFVVLLNFLHLFHWKPLEGIVYVLPRDSSLRLLILILYYIFFVRWLSVAFYCFLADFFILSLYDIELNVSITNRCHHLIIVVVIVVAILFVLLILIKSE